MNLTRFVENLLLRDVLSYVLPGCLIMLTFISYGLDNGSFIPAFKTISDVGGQSAALLGFIGTGYVIGYLASTVLFYVRDRISWFKRTEITSIRPEVMAKLKEVFGDWVEKANHHYLAGICLHYVELRNPDYYYEKIDRRTSMRNFEIGIAAVLIVLGITQLIAFHEWLKVITLLPLLGAFAMMRSSKNLEAAIDRITFITFFTVASANSKESLETKGRRNKHE